MIDIFFGAPIELQVLLSSLLVAVAWSIFRR